VAVRAFKRFSHALELWASALAHNAIKKISENITKRGPFFMPDGIFISQMPPRV
jgi:hypothetical protein